MKNLAHCTDYKLIFIMKVHVRCSQMVQIIKGKLPLAPMNYRVSAIYPHEFSSAIPDPLKLPNPSQQPSFVIQFR